METTPKPAKNAATSSFKMFTADNKECMSNPISHMTGGH